jgi:hypothetical protein
MYYLVIFDKSIKLLKTDVKLRNLQILYNEFYKNTKHSIKYAYFPKKYLECELEKANTKIYKKYVLEYNFIFWLYNEYNNNIFKYYLNYNIYKYYLNFNKKNKLIEDLEVNKNIEDLGEITKKNIDKIIEDVDYEIIDEKDKIIDEIIVEETNQDKTTNKIEDLQKKIDLVKTKKNEYLEKKITFEKTIENVIKNIEDIDVKEEEDNSNLFNKKHNLKYKYFNDYLNNYNNNIIEPDIIIDENNAYEYATMIVVFHNSNTLEYGTVILDHSDIKYLKNLNDIGLNDIIIKDLILIDKPQYLIEDLMNYKEINKTIFNNKYILEMFNIRKILEKKPHKSIFIKTVIEFIYSNYTIDINNSIDIKTFYNDFHSYNQSLFRLPLNIVIDKYMFISIINYLNIPIKDSKILYFKKEQKDKISLGIEQQVDYLLKTPYILKKSNQLRAEPIVNNSLNPLSIWLNSSHLMPLESDLWMNKSKLEI